jgi:hypothetical protein
MANDARGSIPKPVLDELVQTVEREFSDDSNFEHKFARVLLRLLKSAIDGEADPADRSLTRREILDELGYQKSERSGLNAQLKHIAARASTWRAFTVRGQSWWGRLIGPTGAARDGGSSDRLYFLPEVFPNNSILGLRRRDEALASGIESVSLLVGDAEDLTAKWLFPLLPTANRIDLVNAYHVNEWVRDKLDAFRGRESAELRACFMNVFDEELLRVFRRKVYDRSEEVIRHRVGDSIQKVLRCEPVDLSGGHLRIKAPEHPPRARFSIYLTPQRITYSYWRVDDRAIIVPLDVKLSQDPRPIAWALAADATPRAFAYYATDSEALFEEQNRVYTTAS